MNKGIKAVTKTTHKPKLPALDWDLCVKLASNKTFVAQEILNYLIKELPTELKAIRQAKEEGNYPELLRCVHKLHGALCYSGTPRLKNAVAKFETVLKQGDFTKTALDRLTAKLESEAEDVLLTPLPY